MIKKIIIPVFALMVCISVIWKWTSGFTAFTIFSYTLKEAGEVPRTFPDLSLTNQDSSVFYLKNLHKYVLINFVYLNCPYVCHKVNNQLEQIYHEIDTALVPSALEFITVSFDSQRDNVQRIRKYRNLFGPDIKGWNFAIPNVSDDMTFTRFLDNIGIWKYKVPSTGIINHSVYIFLISPEGKVIKVFDPVRENNDQMVKEIQSCIKGDII